MDVAFNTQSTTIGDIPCGVLVAVVDSKITSLAFKATGLVDQDVFIFLDDEKPFQLVGSRHYSAQALWPLRQAVIVPDLKSLKSASLSRTGELVATSRGLDLLAAHNEHRKRVDLGTGTPSTSDGSINEVAFAKWSIWLPAPFPGGSATKIFSYGAKEA